MSRQRKTAAVLRLLRGKDLETVSRGLGVTDATLTGWRDAFLAASEASPSTRPKDGDEVESERLKAKLGGMLLGIERGQDVAQMIVRWRAVGESPKPAQHRQFLVAEAGDVGDGLRASQNRQRHNSRISSSGYITLPRWRGSGKSLKYRRNTTDSSNARNPPL